ncbi:MAG TPA: lipopolysaccharide biosynthesis protein, partial [Polyangiaceae bacterium]|nr:lipopolysaccharide biosynthesis protein [Polyangiaceae bacterium]
MLKKLLDLLRDALIYGVGGTLGQVIGFLLLPLYTDRLSPTEYGQLAMLTIVSALFPTLAFLGMRGAIFRFFSLTKDETERATALGLGFSTVTVGTVALLLVSWIFSDVFSRALFGAENLDHLLRFALLSAAANSIGNVPQIVLRAARRAKTTTAINTAKTLFSVGATVWLVVGLERGVWGVVVGALVADVVFTLLQVAITWRYYRFAANLPLLRRMLSYGLPYLPSRLLTMGTVYLSTYMLRQLMGLDDAGLYSVAARFAVPISIVVAALTQAWLPYRFKIFAEDADPASFFRTTVTYYVAVIGYLWVGVCVWGPEAIRLLTNARFHAAAGLLPALALIPVMEGFYQMVNTGVEIGDDTRVMPLVSLSGLIVVAGATALLVPLLGAAGAAFATMLGWIAMTAAIYRVAQRRFHIPYDWMTLIALAAIAIASVACSVLVQKLTLSYRS